MQAHLTPHAQRALAFSLTPSLALFHYYVRDVSGLLENRAALHKVAERL